MNKEKYKEMMTSLADFVISELKSGKEKTPEEIKTLTEAARISGNAYLYSVEVGLEEMCIIHPHEL